MPKKKKRRPQKSAAKPVRRSPNQNARLVDAFHTWRSDRGLDPDDGWIIEPLIELKRDYLDVPDPTVWPERETYELLTTMLPRKIYVEEEDYERIAPTVDDFFTFLHETGRWSRHSMPFEEVPDLIAELTEDIPDRLSDPALRGMSGNIIHYALSQGVDLTDQTAMAAFIQQYNTMSEDDRHAITDTGRPANSSGKHPRGAAFGLGGDAVDPDRPFDAQPFDADPFDADPFDADPFDANPFDSGPADGDLFDIDFAVAWPAFLGDRPADDELVSATDEAEWDEYLTSSALMARADHVMRLLARGRRRLTSTGALRRDDAAKLLEKFGIEGSSHSMWDVAPLRVLWVALQAAGFIDVKDGFAYQAAAVTTWPGPDGDIEERLLAARLLHAAMLAVILGMPDEEESASAYTYMALMKATLPRGVTVIPVDEPEYDEIADEVVSDLLDLVDAGLVTQTEDDDETFYLHPALLGLTPAAMATTMADEEDLRE